MLDITEEFRIIKFTDDSVKKYLKLKLNLNKCYSSIVFFWSEKIGDNKTKAFRTTKVYVWEEKIVDPPIDYITSVNVP